MNHAPSRVVLVQLYVVKVNNINNLAYIPQVITSGDLMGQLIVLECGELDDTRLNQLINNTYPEPIKGVCNIAPHYFTKEEVVNAAKVNASFAMFGSLKGHIVHTKVHIYGIQYQPGEYVSFFFDSTIFSQIVHHQLLKIEEDQEYPRPRFPFLVQNAAGPVQQEQVYKEPNIPPLRRSIRILKRLHMAD